MDTIDRKILAVLTDHAREPHSSLAKKIKVSREVFDYRVKRLEEDSIIQGYQARINLKHFMYGGYILLIQVVGLTQEKEKSIISAIKKLSTLYYIETCGGIYDFVLGVNVQSLPELSTTIDSINDCFGKTKTNITILTMLHELRDSFRPLFISSRERNNTITALDLQTKESLDSIDKKLILALGNDATLSSPQLALHLGMTDVAVRERIKKLIEKKIILGFRAMINLGNLNLQVTSLLIKTNPQSSLSEKKLHTFFHYDLYNTYACQVIGEYSYFVTVFSKDSLGLKQYLTALRNTFPELITHIDILPLFDLVYHKHVPFGTF